MKKFKNYRSIDKALDFINQPLVHMSSTENKSVPIPSPLKDLLVKECLTILIYS